MIIKIKDEEELVNMCREAIYILSNLRKFTKLWEESYGVELKKRKKGWEANADRLIERLNAKSLKAHESIKFETNENSSSDKY